MMNEGYRNSSIYGMLGYFKLLRNDDLDETTKNFVKKLMITTVMTGT